MKTKPITPNLLALWLNDDLTSIVCNPNDYTTEEKKRVFDSIREQLATIETLITKGE